MPFADVIPVPLWNRHRYVALYNCLASKPRMELIPRGLLHAVEFVILHFGKIVVAFLHHHVAGGAGAASSAGMFEVQAEVHRDIKQGFRLSMPFVRQLVFFKFERLTRWKERNFRHLPNYIGPKKIA